MSDLKLGLNDYLAITKAMDANENNRVDPSEATISNRAQIKIGNANGIAGTRETAEALQKGDIFIPKLTLDAADKVSGYFSNRAENTGKPVKQWTTDNWISREDLQMSDSLRSRIDSNSDGKVSRREFADALVQGKITIGEEPVLPGPSSDPFSQKPANKPSVNDDPFAPKQSGNSTADPFGSKPANKPASNNDPFSSKPANNSKPGVSADPFGSKSTPKPSSDPFKNPFGG